MKVMAVLLAAGSGSRFVGPVHKLRAELRGRPLFAHALETLAALEVDERVVVWGSEPLEDLVERAGVEVTLLENPRHAEGQATSLACAVDHARANEFDALVIGLADQPFVDAATWEAVIAAEGMVVTAVYGGRRRPPVKINSSLFSALPRTGDEGARALMRSRPELVTEVNCHSNPVDIDTNEALESWN